MAPSANSASLDGMGEYDPSLTCESHDGAGEDGRSHKGRTVPYWWRWFGS